MEMKRNVVLSLIACFLFVGCGKKETTVMGIRDVDGNVYRQISETITNYDGTVLDARYVRVPDNGREYSKTLSSLMFTNSLPMFYSYSK